MSIVVTGASQGIGRGIAVALAAAGYDVVIGYQTSDVAAKELVQLVEAEGVRAALVSGDVSDPSTHLAFRDAARTLGPLEAWVNNAGVSVLAPVAETAEADLRRMLDVNTVGTFLGLQAAVTELRAAGSPGCIVNIASEVGLQAFPYLGAYAASKFAVVGLTQAAALELAPERITVNAVCPGTAETEMVMAERRSQRELTGASLSEVRESYLDAIPAGRFCTPDDVGALVAYLVSPGASYVTGQSICVNGASVLH